MDDKSRPGKRRMQADPSRKVGRPLLLDARVHDRLVRAVRLGLSWDDAAKAARISTATLHEWRARGRQREEPFATLVDDLEEAEAEGAEEMFRRIVDASEEDWRAAAWVLGARHKYVKPNEVKHTGAVATVSVDGDGDPALRAQVLAVLGAHGYVPPDRVASEADGDE